MQIKVIILWVYTNTQLFTHKMAHLLTQVLVDHLAHSLSNSNGIPNNILKPCMVWSHSYETGKIIYKRRDCIERI